MSDRVDTFLREFESAIDDHLGHEQRARLVARTGRLAEQLSESLHQLADLGVHTRNVTTHDLQELLEELLIPNDPAELGPMMTKASALVTVLEDGLVDGDIDSLRALLERASTVAGTVRARRRRANRTRSTPIDILALEGRTFTNNSRRGIRTVTVVDGQWRLDDGTEHRSPTAAAQAAIGTTASGRQPKVNGRRFWGVADSDADAVE